MYLNTKHILLYANRFAPRNVYANKTIQQISGNVHTTAAALYPNNLATEELLPLPNNIDPSETTRFSPQRTRDINATVIISQFHQMSPLSRIDITADNTSINQQTSVDQDPHVQSYDCNSAVCLNSAMQSNVPSPFGGMHKFSHLNMPGGQWSQESKFEAQYQHNSHYTALRNNVRSGWAAYDQNATVDKKVHKSTWTTVIHRSYSTKEIPTEGTEQKIDNVKPQTKKDQLKKAFKDYGATVVVFHVAISLASLGGCYALVSGGIDLLPMLDYLGVSSSALTNKVATSASSFVIAYAIHKVFAPVRITITLGATPFIVRYLRARGILKPKI